uniref:Arginine kinase n=1 Tax=Macrostomum lignano TaxID=282301 RepID=A0A1I8I6C1_9PLAT
MVLQAFLLLCSAAERTLFDCLSLALLKLAQSLLVCRLAMVLLNRVGFHRKEARLRLLLLLPLRCRLNSDYHLRRQRSGTADSNQEIRATLLVVQLQLKHIANCSSHIDEADVLQRLWAVGFGPDDMSGQPQAPLTQQGRRPRQAWPRRAPKAARTRAACAASSCASSAPVSVQVSALCSRAVSTTAWNSWDLAPSDRASESSTASTDRKAAQALPRRLARSSPTSGTSPPSNFAYTFATALGSAQAPDYATISSAITTAAAKTLPLMEPASRQLPVWTSDPEVREAEQLRRAGRPTSDAEKALADAYASRQQAAVDDAIRAVASVGPERQNRVVWPVKRAAHLLRRHCQRAAADSAERDAAAPEVALPRQEDFDTRPVTSTDVVEFARRAPGGRAPGPDEVPVEALRVTRVATEVARVMNGVLAGGPAPREWTHANIVGIPKKPGTTRKEEHRGISLMSCTAKLFNRRMMPGACGDGVDPSVVSYLEEGYKKLQSDPKCKSLLKRHLTKDVLEKLKNKKTSFGSTLKDVVQSGVENLDSGVGVYAPDAEAYSVFADLFDPIIEEYHGGFKRTDRHPPCTLGDASEFGDVDPEGKYVVSTRIRCGRSLRKFPFNPNMTEGHYKEMEDLVSGTLKGMTGELKGTFYPLTGMTKEVQQQLIDDHFLFKEGDRFLQKANACRYWPTGRGIFHNDSKTFLVWVGEEDHMRIISMQKGGSIREVYGRLVKAVNEIEKRMEFSHDDRLGFLTFCPTNLGTTIRASVHIKLPRLSAGGQEALQRVADRFQLQVRGSAGEHSEAVGGLYDISNKERMGLTEFEAVGKMYRGIAELIKMEKALERGVDPEVVKYVEDGFAKLQASDSCHSLLKKHLTKEVVDRLKNLSTPSFGSTLKDVIQSGVENLDSGVGVYAPDAEAYSVFADLFDPIIEEYHGGFKRTDRHPPCTLGDASEFGDVDPEGKYVVSTRIRCGRSLRKFPFNPNMTEGHYKEMEDLVSGTLKGMTGELKGTFYPLTGMTKEVQQQLIDDHFLFKEGDRFLQKANACRYWPTGRGIFHNDSKTFLVWVGEEDHMRIISMQKGGSIREVYGRLVKAVNEIEKRMEFSHDDRLGFLTFCPTNLGTTIRASVHIKLPRLSAGGQEALQRVADRFQLQVRGSAGEHSEAVGGLYDISNKERMGLTEFEAVGKMYRGIGELIKMEKALERGVDPEVVKYVEDGFAKLQASDSCHSLLKKHLTKEVVDRLKNLSTPSFGSTLKDAYSVFADLFDPIIEEYHGGFKRTDRHPPCTLGDASEFGDVDPEGKYVVSTRIRCGRSLRKFPFNPNMTEGHYKEMEDLVSGTLKGMTGELKGTFYPLTGMTKEVQQQLIDDHFLFKEGDRFLQKANACRYWPTGRGIFHNDSKTFLVWVGEEDHMRIISMQKGGSIREVYGRLVKAVNEIEKRMEFSHDDRLGFLTFCPTNLGTTIRASVHIKLPRLSAGGQEALQRVADRFQLQVRGSAGEHSEAVGGLYDISNKERMGLTEFEAVGKMYRGIGELIKMEKELEANICVKALVDAGANLYSRDETGCTALHYAVWNANSEMVAYLLTEDSKQKSQLVSMAATSESNNGATPLHVACQRNLSDIAAYLLRCNASPLVTNAAGQTAFDLACSGGHSDTVAVLLPACRGFLTEVVSFTDCSPLEEAARGGHANVVQQLLEAGFRVNARSGCGDGSASVGGTALHAACAGLRHSTVQLLLSAGANPAARDCSGRTVVELLQSFGSPEHLRLAEDVACRAELNSSRRDSKATATTGAQQQPPPRPPPPRSLLVGDDSEEGRSASPTPTPRPRLSAQLQQQQAAPVPKRRSMLGANSLHGPADSTTSAAGQMQPSARPRQQRATIMLLPPSKASTGVQPPKRPPPPPHLRGLTFNEEQQASGQQQQPEV